MKGGSYVMDPKTKKKKLVERTVDEVAEGKAAAPAKPDAKEDKQ